MANTLAIPYEPLNQVPFVFPLKGKSEGWSRDAQPEGTTPECLNVWPFDLTGRGRGGTRAGFSKSNTTEMGSGAPYMQAISELDGTDYTTGHRKTFFAAFTQGIPYVGDSPSSSLVAAFNIQSLAGAEAPLATGFYQTTQIAAVLVFLDGQYVWEVLPSVDLSSFPGHSPGDVGPLFGLVGAAHGGTAPSAHPYECCCTYRGRLVLANQGPNGNPQEWLMSRVLDIHDWDVAKRDPSAAVAGSSSQAGQVAEPITALIPYGDDLLLFGADHSLWLLTGDPAAGGSISPVNRGVGVFGPNSWAMDPDRNLFFVGTGGFYKLGRAGYQVTNLSQGVLDNYFNALERGTHLVRCEWDREKHGCWIFVTPVTSGTATHLWWDATTEGFFPIQFPDAMGPTASCTFDDGTANGRSLLIGGRNGFVYQPAPTAGSDDGAAIVSTVWMGPVRPYGSGHRGKFVALDVIMGETPGGFAGGDSYATAALQFADDAYAALTAPAVVATQNFTAVGRNPLWRVRGRGTHAMLQWSQNVAGKVMMLESAVGQWLPGGRVRA